MKKNILILDVAVYTFIALFFLLLVGGFHYPLISRIVDYKGTLTGAYFDLQGLALTIGRLDVPCESLQYEAFHIDGKCYGYFGLTPSFFRIILNGLCVYCLAGWSRLMMLAGGLLTYAGLVLLAGRALADKDAWPRRLWSHGFALVMTFGSSLPFIISDPYGYHEAIIWAGGFTLIGFWAIARYVDGGEAWALRLALFANFMALHSRYTVGVALVCATGFWLLAPLGRLLPARFAPFSAEAMARPFKPALIACLILFGMTLTPPAVQYLKFGMFMAPATAQPFYAKFPERLEKIKDGRFLLKNFRCASELYFGPSMIDFSDKFPWIQPAYREFWFAGQKMPDKVAPYCSDSDVESFDPVFSIPYGLAAPLVLFAFGLAIMARQWAVLRDWHPLLLGSMAACLPLLLLSTITYRYTFDFMPMFIIGGVVAWKKISNASTGSKVPALCVLVLLTLGSLAVNFSASLTSGSPQPYMFRIAAGLHRLVAPTP